MADAHGFGADQFFVECGGELGFDAAVVGIDHICGALADQLRCGGLEGPGEVAVAAGPQQSAEQAIKRDVVAGAGAKIAGQLDDERIGRRVEDGVRLQRDRLALGEYGYGVGVGEDAGQ